MSNTGLKLLPSPVELLMTNLWLLQTSDMHSVVSDRVGGQDETAIGGVAQGDFGNHRHISGAHPSTAVFVSEVAKAGGRYKEIHPPDAKVGVVGGVSSICRVNRASPDLTCLFS